MKRKFALGTVMALVFVLGVTVAAMAAGPGPNGAGAGVGNAGQGAAIHGTFVDENGDGVCDTYLDRTPAQDGTGSQWGGQGAAGQQGIGRQGVGRQGAMGGQGAAGTNFVDADGDGVCDNCLNGGVPAQDGTGSPMRRGGGNR
jgi:hypothetical protein